MTPGEILQDLRDIHLPPAPDAGGGIEVALIPFVLLVLVVLGGAAIALRRRRLWRAQARALLRDLDREPTADRRWAKLVALAAAVGRHTRIGGPPDAIYRPFERIGPGEVHAIRTYIGRALGS